MKGAVGLIDYDRTPLTVAQLVAFLTHPDVPQDALVDLEGCDCSGRCAAVAWRPGEPVWLLRDDQDRVLDSFRVLSTPGHDETPPPSP